MKFAAWLAYHLESRAIVEDYISRISRYLVGHDFAVCEDLNSIKREIADADVMIGWRITPEVFAQAARLKWIQFGSAGIDHTIFPELLASDVIVTTLGGIHQNVLAEHVFAQMLALSRRLDAAWKLQAQRRYDRSEIAATADEIHGKTLGIVGLGRVGQNIARLGKAFGMRVIGTKRTVTCDLPNVDAVYGPDGLDTVIEQSDFLVLAVPLTASTEALLNRERIRRMKTGACLINVARGAMVDHDALKEALGSGRLKGAALDVFPEEPLPSTSPIYDLPNVIITPHTAGSHPQYAERAARVFNHNLTAFLNGGEMINVYDRERGY